MCSVLVGRFDHVKLTNAGVCGNIISFVIIICVSQHTYGNVSTALGIDFAQMGSSFNSFLNDNKCIGLNIYNPSIEIYC